MKKEIQINEGGSLSLSLQQRADNLKRIICSEFDNPDQKFYSNDGFEYYGNAGYVVFKAKKIISSGFDEEQIAGIEYLYTSDSSKSSLEEQAQSRFDESPEIKKQLDDLAKTYADKAMGIVEFDSNSECGN